MRGLTSESGGMVAAATLGLPERAEAGRNYDYRYAWIRDQGYAGEALAAVGGGELMDRGVRFVAERVVEDGPQLCPAYQVDGRRIPRELRLPHLPGYPGGEPRAGNRVNKQFQLDALGEVLLHLAAAGRLDRLDSLGRDAIEVAVGAIGNRWREADAGIWELEDRRWTHSRLTCVAGLRAAAAVVDPRRAADWIQLADTILADVGSECVHPTGRWQRSPDDPGLDASLLLPSLRGAVPRDDPRTLATLAAVEDQLASDGYVYRFRHDERPLDQAEGAFVLCGFLMALAANQQGREREAIAWFERNRSACGPPGLFTEEFDVGERQLRGNIPQAFVHALLLESAARLAETAPELSGRKSQL
jgi:alpha,alpha-trehalase